MSYIPSHAMPHAYANDDEGEEGDRKRREGAGSLPNALLIGGGALLGYLLYRALR